MIRYGKLYIKFLKQYIKSLMEYRLDFFIGIIGFLFVQITGIIFLRLIFGTIPSLNGWSFYEILYIYGFAQIPRGIDHVFTDYIWTFSSRSVVNGEFDRYLLRPLNPLFQVIAEKFQPDGFGEIIVGITLFITASLKLNIYYSPLKILLLIFVILSATIIYTAIKLAVASIAFWVKFAQSYLFMIYQLSSFAKYPVSIYPNTIKNILTFIVPFAFTGFYPGSYFLGKESILIGVLMTFIVAIISIIVAYLIWLKGISVYESAGN